MLNGIWERGSGRVVGIQRSSDDGTDWNAGAAAAEAKLLEGDELIVRRAKVIAVVDELSRGFGIGRDGSLELEMATAGRWVGRRVM